jgi:hypothetical protein
LNKECTMRAGRFGSKAGRVAVVAAFVLGTLAVGTVAANADELATTDGKATTTIGQAASQALARTLEQGWE